MNSASETKYYNLSSGIHFTQSAYVGTGNDKTKVGYGFYDGWIARLNENFEVEQEYIIGGDDDDRIDFIGEFYNGDLLVVMMTASDSSGNLVTSKDPASSTYDEVVLRMHPNGYIRWETRIGGLSYEGINDVYIDHDTVWLFGYSNSDSSAYKTSENFGGSDYWLVSINEWGEKLVDKSYGGQFSDVGESILVIGNDIYLSGTSNSPAGSGNKTVSPINSTSDSWVIKVDKNGEILKQGNVGGFGFDVNQSLVYKNEEKFYLVCESNSVAGGDKVGASYGGYDLWIIEMDTALNILSQKSYGGSLSERLNKIKYVYGDYFLMGHSQSDTSGNIQIKNEGDYDLLFIVFDSEFNIKSTVSLGGFDNDYLYDVIVDEPGKLTFCAGSYSYFSGDKKVFSYSNTNSEQGWLFKMNLALNEPEKFGIKFLEVFPNPVSDVLSIKIPQGIDFEKIKIYDQMGKEVYTDNIPTGQVLLKINTTDLPIGMYECHILGRNIKLTEKILVK